MHNEESWLTPARKEKLLNATLILIAVVIGAGITYLVNNFL
ncbi:hypothetical protein ACWE42_02365 [Sutcliffiella cohnii]|nr:MULTISPECIES: hypothetical protein [Sutcliffiella]MED4019078.1 hypothetical protein [Sutcliffiella cohnii]WBL13828.1 hypothetical protein O1A01_18210 [Sutcliffiella sp. NC1]